MTPRFASASVLALSLLALPATSAAQPQTLQQVRELYSQAAYEDALGVLSRLPDTESATEAGRYRAACLIALGRTDEAQKTVAALIEKSPEYQPDPSDTSPRVLELFRTTKRQLLPQIARRMYSDAKAAMDRKELPAAIKGFEDLIRVIEEPALKEETTLSELKLLASGFLELSQAQLAAAKPGAAAATAAAPVGELPATPPVIVAAVPVRQNFPAWVPPDTMSQRSGYQGAVRVRIGADGKVTAATMITTVHPAYDAMLLEAARNWQYEPARQNGVPVVSERTVQVVLKPR